MTKDRSNILVLMTDQQQAAAMSCAGDPDVNTPAMDFIAERGVRFERAYTNFPLCAPMRVSMVTGRWPHQLGITGNSDHAWADAWPAENVLGRRLSAVGYRCAWAGKDRVLPDWGYEHLCGYGDVKTADHVVKFLEEHDAKQPFFAAGVFQNPHNICEWSRGQPLYEGGIPEEPKLEDMPLLPANFEPCPYEAEAIDLFAGQTPHIYEHRMEKTVDYWRRHRWAYRRLIERVDAQIGRILEALRKSGTLDNTMIILTSDHGDADGAHRWSSKSVLFEETVRVPLLACGPGIPRGVVNREHLVNVAMDHVPTVLELAGLPSPDWVDGEARSYAPLLRGQAPRDWRESLCIETHLTTSQGTPPQGNARAMIHGDMKYCCYWHGQHREQLFDLRTDPGEMVNLAVSRRHRPVLEEMRRRLVDWCKRTDDKGFIFQIPGHEIMSPGSDRY